MKIDAENFNNKNKEILDLIEKTRKFDGNLNEKLDRLKKNIENESFTLAIVGQFKRGKTTTINAILGNNLLPTAVLPLTSVITTIHYGAQLKIRVIFEDNKQMEIKKGEIEQYVTEKLNPKNVKKVQRVDIEAPSNFLAHGVTLVDTPGIGSIYKHNTDVAFSFLPEADAIIFVLSADPPISEAECQFLEESAKYAYKFFFVLNKIDYLESSEIKEVIDFNRGVIASKMKTEKETIKIFPLSAKNALERKIKGEEDERLLNFERELESFIVSKKGSFVLGVAAARLRRIVEGIITERLIEKSSLTISSETLEQRIKKFDEELQKILHQKEYNEELINIEQKKILEIIDEDLDKLKKEITPSLTKKIVDYATSLENKNNTQFANAIDDYRQESILHELEQWRNAEQEKVVRIFSERMTKYSSKANEVITEIEKLATGLFDVKIESKKTEEKFIMESGFYFKLSKEDEIKTISMVQKLLPKSIFKKQLVNSLPVEIEEDIDRNCGRMRYDFLVRLQKSAIKFKGALEEKIDIVINSIREANEKAKEVHLLGKEKIEKRVKEIENEIKELNSIINKLNEIEKDGFDE
ncbi:MAG: dynamin family protein [Candidatus Bilamarchaeaceae archaeon]